MAADAVAVAVRAEHVCRAHLLGPGHSEATIAKTLMGQFDISDPKNAGQAKINRSSAAQEDFSL